MNKVASLLVLLLASGTIVAACSGNSSGSSDNSGSSSTSAASTTQSDMTAAPKPAALPIPLNKLKSAKVGAGNVAAGKVVFDANCQSCHGAGARNQGGPGPTLAGTGIKASQVAFMVLNPAAIDPESGMPKLTLTSKELADVAAYVASLK